MKYNVKTRFLSLVLCVCMLVPMLTQVIPVFSVGAEEKEVEPITSPFTPETEFLINGKVEKSQSYRIPSMVTLDDGTIVAAADIRWNTTYDGGGLDTLVARSTDGGKTWKYTVANYLGDNGNEYNAQSSTFIDPSLLVAKDGKTVYMLVDLYAYGVSLNGLWGEYSQPATDTGFDSNGNLKLSDDDHNNYNYYLKDGKIYNSSNEVVEGYDVDPYFNVTYTQNGEIKQSNLFFADSPYKVARTQYLYLTKSTDGGESWSEPTLLDVRVKAKVAATENALLVSPGNSITTSGGIMVYPVYSYKTDGTQHVALIYSTDGVNWMRSSDYTALNWSSEGSIVELQNGTLRVFVRNKTSYLCYVDFDMKTMSWIGHTQTTVPTNSNTQLSAITYSKTFNGQQVILVSCPTGPNEAGSANNDGKYRTNGKIFVGVVAADGTMSWPKSIDVGPYKAMAQLQDPNYTEDQGFFAYSCLTERSDGSVAILYENNQFGWGAGEKKYFTITAKAYAASALGIKLDAPETVVVDSEGNRINSITMGMYDKPVLTAKSPFNTADVKYQWQICYDVDNNLWVDIYGEDEKTVKLSFGMVATLLDEDGSVNIRCETKSASLVAYSKTIPVTLEMYQPEEPDVVVSESVTTSNGETVTVTVAGNIPEDASVALEETDSTGIEVAPGETVTASLDISIKNADGTEWQPESGEKVNVNLEASKIGLKDGDTFVVYHLHNGEVKILGTYTVVNNTVSFEVDGFSKFVFALTNVEPEFDLPDFSADVGKHATLITPNGDEAFFVTENEPDVDWDTGLLLSATDFSEDVVFSIDAYKIVVEDYADGTTEITLWYQLSVVSGTADEQFFADGYWMHQKYLQGEDTTTESLTLFDAPEEPEEPEEPKEPSCGITVNGVKVPEIEVSPAVKVTVTATPENIEGSNVTYQWQILIPAVNMWVNIYGQTAADCTINYGMVAARLDANGQAHIRCITTVDGTALTSEPLAVNVVSARSIFNHGTHFSFIPANDVATVEETENGSTTIYNVLIQYVFTDGRQAANPWTATIEAGGEFSGTINSPTVMGYAPDKTSIELNIENISDNLTYTVTYLPAEVKFSVVHKIQNVNDEEYSVYRRDPKSGYTDSAVGKGLSLTEDEMKTLGVYDLPYDIEQKIAADGTTEVVITYDRYYFLMSFDLGGGYGVEPIYARVDTPINVGTPIRAGYAFTGWSPAVPEKMPAEDMTITAQWTPGDTTYTVVYWAENANDNNYSFWSYKELGAVSGTTVSGSDDFNGTDSLPKTGFHFDHADQNVTVKGDGSTVVNVYYKRNTYDLIFAYSGGPEICGGTHNHSNCKLICGMSEHAHSSSCCDLGGNHRRHTCNTNNCEYDYEHTHSSSCYDCGKVAHTSHSVEYGCYGMKFEGIKYGQDTSSWWSQVPTMKWLVSYNDSTFYTAAPAMPNSDLYIYGTSQSGSSTIYYYEIVDGNKTTNSVRPSYTVNTDGWTFTEEDYVVVPGFSFHSSEYGKTSGWFDPVTQYYIYYTRNSYSLTFKNGNETKEAGKFLYQADISGQYYVPTYNGDDPEGYTFAGWYTTEKCIEGTEWNHESATMPYNNLILYAKWVPVTHNVKLYKTQADLASGNQYLSTITVDHNTTADEPARPSNGGYNFVGWFYMEDGVEKAFDFEIPVRKDLNLYGKWVADELATYTIKYAIKNSDGSLTYIANDTNGSALAGVGKTFDAKSGTELYEGYQTGYYPETNSHSMKVLLDSDNTYTFIYVPKDEVQYTVKYLEKGTEDVLATEKTDTTREAIHTENFVFIQGYRPDAYQKRIVLSANEKENVIIFWYEKDTTHAPVLVKHYLQNAAGTGYNTANPYLTTTDLDGVIGSAYPVDIITTLEGFKFSKAEASYDLDETKTSVAITIGDTQVSAVVTQYGLLIELYYDRVECPYEFKFLEQGTDKVLADSVTGTAIFGSQVIQAAKSIPGYKCTVQNHSITIQLEDGTTAVKNVRIFYYVEETVNIQYVPVGSGTTNPSSQTNIPVLSGTVGGSTATPNEGYKFVGWFKDQACTIPVDSSWISGNKITPVKTKTYGDEVGYESATYYAKFEEIIVNVKYESEIGGSVSRTEESTGMATGAFKGSTATPNTGYSFIGWYDGETKVSGDLDFIPQISDAGKTFTAKFVENKVTINYEVVGPTGCGTVGLGSVSNTGTSVSETIGVVTGDPVGSTAKASSNVYKFVGWYDVDNKLLSTDPKWVPSKVDGLNVAATYYAKFEYNLTSLTIDKAFPSDADYSMDVNQSFLFNVVEVDERGNVVSNGVDLTVTVHADGSVTIDGLTVGQRYKITEKTDWSWRYGQCIPSSDLANSQVSDNSIIVMLTADAAANQVTFTNTRSEDKWLDGDSWCDNIFTTAIARNVNN